jgi:hypothetical protein
MPAFVLLVPIDLDKLLKDRYSTTDALGGEPGAVVKVAV